MRVQIQRVDKVKPMNEAMAFCSKISSETWEGRVDGKVACVWGLILPTLLSEQVYLWLYSNELVDQHQFIFVRNSQRLVEEILKRYELIVGHCLIENDRGRRWLKWLGASFGEPDGKKLPFTIRRKMLNG